MNEVEKLRGLLVRCDEYLAEKGVIRDAKLRREIRIALSQQAEPAPSQYSDVVSDGGVDPRNAPAPAQDEQSPEQMLSREQIENIARKVHGDCTRLPGATYQHAAEAAVMYTLERIAQAEQRPISRETIRAVFLRNGFTVKEGQTDLKPYVYAAAEELLRLSAAPQRED